MREPITPTAYVPFDSVDAKGIPEPKAAAAFIVRTTGDNPLALASMLRRAVSRARPELRVSNIRTQTELIQQHTIRERLLALLALFFAGIAMLLAGIGLYGVLDYSVLQRRREIGIRIAIGAQAGDILRRVTTDVLVMVAAGTICGLALGLVSARYIESLLYEVTARDPMMLAVPALAILGAVLLAAVAPVIRALRIDPAAILRAE